MTLEYFGSPDQQAMARRGEALFHLIGHDPRYSWYGRNVALADFAQGGVDVLADLTRLQGAAVAYLTPREQIGSVCNAIEAKGLRSDWMGWCCSEDASSPDHAAEVIETISLPDDLTVLRFTPDTPVSDCADLATLAIDAGVLPPSRSVLCGTSRQGVTLLARDRDGRAVACAASYRNFHPDSALADHAWWGMLATAPDRRGQGIAIRLGAQAMATMAEESGLSRFMTGIRDDNRPSLGLCARLGVRPSPYVIAMAMDPTAFSDNRITK